MDPEKLENLNTCLRDLGSVLVAFSGGVDSGALLAVANAALPGKVLAVTAVSPTLPAGELDDARHLARHLGVPHLVVETHELDHPEFRSNPPRRCYYCKHELFSRLSELAAQEGMAAVVEGSNADDLLDFRPGRLAISQMGIRSPLAELGFSKPEVRELARMHGLSVASKPAAACLASRFPYGEPITVDKLRRVELAEVFLRTILAGSLRVRSHGDSARIEVEPSQIPMVIQERTRISQAIMRLGFTHVSLDLLGYRTGSMNEGLPRGTRDGVMEEVGVIVGPSSATGEQREPSPSRQRGQCRG